MPVKALAFTDVVLAKLSLPCIPPPVSCQHGAPAADRHALTELLRSCRQELSLPCIELPPPDTMREASSRCLCGQRDVMPLV